MIILNTYKRLGAGLAITALSTLLQACSSGGGSDKSFGGDITSPGGGATNPSTPTPQNPSGSGSTGSSSSDSAWSKGVYQPQAYYANLCQNPRTGTNPITQEKYPDKQGSIALENHFLRSWSHQNYFWYEELPDLDPNDYTETSAYFKLLKTNEKTPGNRPKDRFHFAQDELVGDKLSETGQRGSHGINWKIDANEELKRNYIYVTYIEPNSPAVAAGVTRGMELTHINTIKVENITEAQTSEVNEALFSPVLGKTYTFTLKDLNGVTTNKQIKPEDIDISAVYNRSVIETSSGKVGYLSFHTFNIFSAEDQLKEAFDFLNAQNVDDLVVDLRYNGGGYLFISSQLAYLVAGDSQTKNEEFGRLQYNDKRDDETKSYDFTSVTLTDTNNIRPLNALNLNRVYVLTTKDTCSASESFMNGLRGIGVEVIQIGTTTCGKPHGFQGQANCGTRYFSIDFEIVNGQGFGGYEDGFTPVTSNGDPLSNRINGCTVEDDLTLALGDKNEGMLKTALYLRENGSCPRQGSNLNNAAQPYKLSSPASTPAGGALLSQPPSHSIQRLAPWETR
ncbi:S41 family peptidase [Marinagarivorans algicola]|uniref:S41 family peptidase n=1 Tax=Marinagarivorans algicola TaxID=1513270 RepID=UPI0006B94C3B|nr:S41 family peptidase [Marinagarivorans algicola]